MILLVNGEPIGREKVTNVKNDVHINNVKNDVPINPLTAEWALRALSPIPHLNGAQIY